jgi:DNA (cytosine-5)-methyltransferase 1
MGNFSKKQSPFTLVEAESDISGYAIAKEWDRLQMGEHSDKYLNLAKSHTERPVRTVSAIGGSSGAAAVTHPTERRKFTIAELRRICGFPDDFVLTGTYAQQWERLGRAVPPVMMCAIASSVRDLLLAV